MKFAGWAFIFLIVLTAIEIASYAIGTFYIIPRANFIFYRRPAPEGISDTAFKEYLGKRDPVLGWPSPSTFGGERFDSSGSRWIPSFPAVGTEVVSLYGDSYTYAEDVGHDKAWSNLLSGMLGARVANFGVGGYGTDQAYLRFKQNTHDPAPTVVLSIYPDNLKRNVNQQRYFLTPSSKAVFGLKPRFVMANDAIERVPLPEMSYSDYRESFDDPDGFFHHEFCLPGTSYGPVYWSFPYTAGIIEAAISPQVRDWLAGKPGWSGFVRDDHPSGASTLTAHIIREFASLAKKRNKRAVVVLLPSQTSYERYVRSGDLTMKPLLDTLRKMRIDAHDLTEEIYGYLSERPYSELKVSKASGHPHFNGEGNELVAKLVYQLIVERKE